eukprot:1022778-Prorocentrum_minimum.AAC.3
MGYIVAVKRVHQYLFCVFLLKRSSIFHLADGRLPPWSYCKPTTLAQCIPLRTSRDGGNPRCLRPPLRLAAFLYGMCIQVTAGPSERRSRSLTYPYMPTVNSATFNPACLFCKHTTSTARLYPKVCRVRHGEET